MLENYLKFRFKTNNIPKYQKYFEEWVGNLTHEQIIYFEKEMFNLIKSGKYEP